MHRMKLLVYCDDVLSISHKTLESIEEIRASFKLKGDKAVIDEIYLGGDIVEVESANGTKCWTLSS